MNPLDAKVQFLIEAGKAFRLEHPKATPAEIREAALAAIAEFDKKAEMN